MFLPSVCGAEIFRDLFLRIQPHHRKTLCFHIQSTPLGFYLLGFRMFCTEQTGYDQSIIANESWHTFIHTRAMHIYANTWHTHGVCDDAIVNHHEKPGVSFCKRLPSTDDW